MAQGSAQRWWEMVCEAAKHKLLDTMCQMSILDSTLVRKRGNHTNGSEGKMPKGKQLSDRAQLAWDGILQKTTVGIPTQLVHIMQHEYIERIAGAQPGDYKKAPEETYLAYLHAIGVCTLGQYIPLNPLTMGDEGYDGERPRGATTGAEHTTVDGILVDSPEAVIEHLERFIFPRLRQQMDAFDEQTRTQEILRHEAAVQAQLGPDILKTGYGFIRFPTFRYTTYGYEHYLMAYALYPEMMERDFSLQADLALMHNRAAASAYHEGGLPPFYRLDHDMADSRGTLVNITSLDTLWFPHFARCLAPVLTTDVRLLWHCDGNLMEMVPRLIEVGVRGFQGFQYECGMDYERLCRMKTPQGEHLLIMAGVSVTRTLPMGSPSDVRQELRWLVEYGPPTGLSLGCSSSVCPGVPWANIETLVQGLRYYRIHGRG